MISTAGLMPLHPGKLLDHEGLVTFCSSYAAMDTSFAEAKPIPIWVYGIVYGIIKVCLWLFDKLFQIHYITFFSPMQQKTPESSLASQEIVSFYKSRPFSLVIFIKGIPDPPRVQSIDFPD